VVALSCGLSLAPLSALAKPCDAADNASWVTGAKECLVIRTFRSAGDLSHAILVVVLHGDVSSGGPANYHFAFAQKVVGTPDAQNLVAVAMVRPGYPDGAGNTSTGDDRRYDHYTLENIDAVADAVRHLKELRRAASCWSGRSSLPPVERLAEFGAGADAVRDAVRATPP